MDERQAARIWDQNAETWTELARDGYDIYRDNVNTPGFLEMLPEVKGLHGLDIGCGEGGNTRLLAAREALMTAVDVSPRFVAAAGKEERREPLDIRYQCGSAAGLPYPDESFDFATAFMSLMDVFDQERALAEIHRILKPGGFLQFSINHPCFVTPQWRWVHGARGEPLGVVCGQYFDQPQGKVEQWIFRALPPDRRVAYPPFKVPRFPRTLSSWMNLLVDAGFAVERCGEPRADEEAVERCPEVADSRVVAHFLILRGRKPPAVRRKRKKGSS